MTKIICTQNEYDELSTVLMDNPEFLADISILYDIVEESLTISKVANSASDYDFRHMSYDVAKALNELLGLQIEE